ncbi:DUF4870 domain-containing protein [Flavobacterium sp. SM2513]|uniref:DUF4870 domain-containing protein n=1 Tax=Flavobacterium sp. SM2513 TaxID=3424766 RepID=UPI003D7FF429
MEKITHTNTATATHLSSLFQYCIPFGNFIFPIIIWATSKDKSEFVDEQGKEVINFQLSLFIYSLILVLIAVPIVLFMIFNNTDLSYYENADLVIDNFNFAEVSGGLIIAAIAIFFLMIIKTAEFFLIIYAAVKVSQETHFKYPATIKFLK